MATEAVVDFEMSLYDVQKASISGIHSEFLCSSRIDNLASCFVAVEALVGHAEAGLETDTEVSIAALFDHEEVGSSSTTGAGCHGRVAAMQGWLPYEEVGSSSTTGAGCHERVAAMQGWLPYEDGLLELDHRRRSHALGPQFP